MLVNLAPRRRERVLRLAAHAPELRDRLASFIDDPRVKRDARERVLEERLLTRGAWRSRRRRRKRARG
jgi:hypothetical protein